MLVGARGGCCRALGFVHVVVDDDQIRGDEVKSINSMEVMRRMDLMKRIEEEMEMMEKEMREKTRNEHGC